MRILIYTALVSWAATIVWVRLLTWGQARAKLAPHNTTRPAGVPGSGARRLDWRDGGLALGGFSQPGVRYAIRQPKSL